MDQIVISCGALVYRTDPGLQILLIKQRKDDIAWGIPKGQVEQGETYTQTAKREVKEETGISIKLVGKLPHVFLKKKKFKKIVIPYLAVQTCNSLPRSNNKNSEVFDARWFNIRELPPIYSYQQSIVDTALVILQDMFDI